MTPVIASMTTRLSRVVIFATTLVAVGLIGLVDYITGLELTLSIFYVGPVAVATWLIGIKAGLTIALVCSITSLAVDLNAGYLYSSYAMMIWNGFVHLGSLAITATLLYILRGRLEFEQRLARTDSLTGALNSRSFMEQLRYNLDLAARQRQPSTLAYVDLDDFKRINDQRGHDEGNKVLQAAAHALVESVRRTDIVARLGGDEFALLLPNTDQTGAESVITKARTAFYNQVPDITCSIGVVTFRNPINADQAVRAADLLMYDVKRQGKNGLAFTVFDTPSNNTPFGRPGGTAKAAST
jgi:diguanylate cyclase (GGDEF)-like protein